MEDKQNEKLPIFQQDLSPGAVTQASLVAGGNAKGDLYYGLDGVKFTRLGIGSTNQVLTVVSGVPAWQTATGITTLTGTTPTVALGTTNKFIITLSGNTTYSISGASIGLAFVVIVQQGSGTTYTNTWFSGVTWETSGGTAPVQTTTSNGFTTYGFICTASGVYHGYLVGTN